MSENTELTCQQQLSTEVIKRQIFRYITTITNNLGDHESGTALYHYVNNATYYH